MKVQYDLRREKAECISLDIVKVCDRPVMRNMNETELSDMLALRKGEDWCQEGFDRVLEVGLGRLSDPFFVVIMSLYVITNTLEKSSSHYLEGENGRLNFFDL